MTGAIIGSGPIGISLVSLGAFLGGLLTVMLVYPTDFCRCMTRFPLAS